MQSSIAVLTLAILLVLILGPKRHKKTRPKHLQALLTAVVEFHKNQCYFAGAIQIASIIYILTTEAFTVLNVNFLFTTATNGIVPIVFILIVVSRYGRQSWYLILLSLTVFALSTTTLALCSWWRIGNKGNQGQQYYTDLQITSCGSFNASQLSYSWCGTNVNYSVVGLYGNVDISTEIRYLLMWAHSCLWLLYYIFRKLWTEPLLQQILPSFMTRLSHSRMLHWGKTVTWSWQCLSIMAWSLSFGYQFYLYSLVFAQSAVSTKWTFGQIVAITVWAPCLVEYVNLEISMPSLHTVFRPRY